tara:strand:+ start:3232 stop:3405 length:174 start_codon:yes stop_codon:yes gene_type:complete
MKITNLSARDSKQLKHEPKNINTIDNGITRRLLEKYKPRNLYNVDDMSKINKTKRVA